MSNHTADRILYGVAILAGIASFAFLLMAVWGSDAGSAVEVGLLK